MDSIEKAMIMPIFAATAQAIFDWIDNHKGYYQNQTYNLRDSTGVGVFKDGVLVEWISNPAPIAQIDTPYLSGDSMLYTYINGRDLLNEAIKSGQHSDFAKYTLVLYSAAPYGVEVDEGGGKRGTGWWSQGLIPLVEKTFISESNKYMNK